MLSQARIPQGLIKLTILEFDVDSCEELDRATVFSTSENLLLCFSGCAVGVAGPHRWAWTLLHAFCILTSGRKWSKRWNRVDGFEPFGNTHAHPGTID